MPGNKPMSGNKMSATEAADVGGGGGFSGTALSDWLRMAIGDAAQREPVLAAEDSIMLVDIVEALSKEAIAMGNIILNPMIGSWLKKAILDNRNRPRDDVLKDVEYLRDLLITKVLMQYQSGDLPGTDLEIRIFNIVNMVWGAGKSVLSPWSRQAAASLRTLSDTADGGVSKVADHIEAERAGGHDEMADMLQHISYLPRHEIKKCLLMAADGLTSLAHQLH